MMSKLLESMSSVSNVLTFLATTAAAAFSYFSPNYLSLIILLVVVLPFLCWFYLQKKRFGSFNRSLQVFKDYTEMQVKFFELIDNEIKNKRNVEIKNIGLDLEYPLRDINKYLQNKLITNNDLKLIYKGLLLNPLSSDIKDLVDGNSNVRSVNVYQAYEKIKLFKADPKYKNISFHISHYDYPLIIHGFLLGKTHLFLGFSELDEGKIRGSDKSYIYLEYDVNLPATTHYFNFFENWFDYLYKKGNENPISQLALLEKAADLEKECLQKITDLELSSKA